MLLERKNLDNRAVVETMYAPEAGRSRCQMACCHREFHRGLASRSNPVALGGARYQEERGYASISSIVMNLNPWDFR